jgi:hypothetical protein
MKKKKIVKSKKSKLKDEDISCLYYDLSNYLIPRLRRFKEISISYPCDETSESWNEKLDFIADSLEKVISDDYHNLPINEMIELKQQAQKAAKMLGEVWFDLWS